MIVRLLGDVLGHGQGVLEGGEMKKCFGMLAVHSLAYMDTTDLT